MGICIRTATHLQPTPHSVFIRLGILSLVAFDMAHLFPKISEGILIDERARLTDAPYSELGPRGLHPLPFWGPEDLVRCDSRRSCYVFVPVDCRDVDLLRSMPTAPYFIYNGFETARILAVSPVMATHPLPKSMWTKMVSCIMPKPPLAITQSGVV